MSNKPFTFRHFTIQQDRCAMKVGTDSMILGAWASCPDTGRVLDLGTGTGVLSLMIAQRYPTLTIEALEIDREAAFQAQENVANSPWSSHIAVIPSAIQAWQGGPYDMIISNPPFFGGFYDSGDEGRIKARAGVGLPPTLLVQQVTRLLTNEGSMTIVLPTDPRWEAAFEAGGLFVHQRLFVRDNPQKPAKRMYLTLKKYRPHEIIETIEFLKENAGGKFTEWYKDLTIDFHLPGAIS